MMREAILAAALLAGAGAPAWAAALTQTAAAAEGARPVTQKHDNVQSAVATPAQDLNLSKTPIPEVLKRAQANPYEMKGLDRCSGIALELARLNAALGPDRDAPPPKDTRTLNEKRGDTAGTVLKTGVEAVIPYRGVIRYVSGASKYEKQMNDAISAGYERRGYLKGMGLRMNCPPPAAPAWFRPAVARPVPVVARPAPAGPARKP
jgi:hypothetical protein